MPGPGAYIVGEEEKKEVMEVLEAGYLSRYGKPENPKFKKKVFTLRKSLQRSWEQSIVWPLMPEPAR